MYTEFVKLGCKDGWSRKFDVRVWVILVCLTLSLSLILHLRPASSNKRRESACATRFGLLWYCECWVLHFLRKTPIRARVCWPAGDEYCRYEPKLIFSPHVHDEVKNRRLHWSALDLGLSSNRGCEFDCKGTQCQSVRTEMRGRIDWV